MALEAKDPTRGDAGAAEPIDRPLQDRTVDERITRRRALGVDPDVVIRHCKTFPAKKYTGAFTSKGHTPS